MPQRSPAASSVIDSPPTSRSARSTPSPNSGRVNAYGNSGPAATRFGLTSVRPNGRRPSSSRPARMIWRIFSGSYSLHVRRITFGLAGIFMTPSIALLRRFSGRDGLGRRHRWLLLQLHGRSGGIAIVFRDPTFDGVEVVRDHGQRALHAGLRIVNQLFEVIDLIFFRGRRGLLLDR